MPDVTFAELARITRTHVVTLRRLAQTNKLPGAYRLGGRWMFRAESIALLRGILHEPSCAPESRVPPSDVECGAPSTKNSSGPSTGDVSESVDINDVDQRKKNAAPGDSSVEGVR